MNNQEKQAAIMKLAQVRLAINHVLRARAMQKRAYSLEEAVEANKNNNRGPYGWLDELDNTLDANKSMFEKGKHAYITASSLPRSGDNYGMFGLGGEIKYDLEHKNTNLQSPRVQRGLNALYEAYNGYPDSVTMFGYGDDERNANINLGLPAWGDDRSMKYPVNTKERYEADHARTAKDIYDPRLFFSSTPNTVDMSGFTPNKR